MLQKWLALVQHVDVPHALHGLVRACKRHRGVYPWCTTDLLGEIFDKQLQKFIASNDEARPYGCAIIHCCQKLGWYYSKQERNMAKDVEECCHVTYSKTKDKSGCADFPLTSSLSLVLRKFLPFTITLTLIKIKLLAQPPMQKGRVPYCIIFYNYVSNSSMICNYISESKSSSPSFLLIFVAQLSPSYVSC